MDVDHIDAMDQLRQSVGLRVHTVSKQPIISRNIKTEGYSMCQQYGGFRRI